jgi:carbon-monoxide dehydrogenase small subunit
LRCRPTALNSSPSGIAKGNEFHPLQQAFHEHHGCNAALTPGMWITALDFRRTSLSPSEAEVREALSAALPVHRLSERQR